MNTRPYTAHFTTSLREELRYFFSDSLLSSVVYIGFISCILLLYAAIGSTTYFGIYNWNQIVWYVIIAELIVANQSGMVRTLTTKIQEGNIAIELSRPHYFPLSQFAVHSANVLVASMATLVWAIPIGIVVGGTSTITMYGIIFGIIAIIFSFVIDYLISFSIGLCAFWTEDANPYAWIYSKIIFIMGGLFFPLEIFPGWLQTIAKILPGAFLVYYPARLFIDFSWKLLLTTIIGQLIYIGIFFAIAAIVYKRATRKVNINGG